MILDAPAVKNDELLVCMAFWAPARQSEARPRTATPTVLSHESADVNWRVNISSTARPSRAFRNAPPALIAPASCLFAVRRRHMSRAGRNDVEEIFYLVHSVPFPSSSDLSGIVASGYESRFYPWLSRISSSFVFIIPAVSPSRWPPSGTS